MKNDTIYRQAAIDAVEKESQVDGAYGYMDTKSIVDLLNALPPAEPDHIAEDSKKVSFAQGQENDSISRQAAIDEATRLFEMGDCYCDRASIVGMLNSLPSAQPEIIYCRDCKYWREGDAYSYCQKLFNCGVLDVYDYMREEDDFCSLAERRE